MKKGLVIFFCVWISLLNAQTKDGFTKADTLRGFVSVHRSCFNVLSYDLDVRVDIHNRFISGSNNIRFRVEYDFSKMQLDLFDNMKVEKILWKGKELPFTRDCGAVFIDFPSDLHQKTIEEIQVFYSGNPIAAK